MTMRFLREKYGDDRANRAMKRQQKKTLHPRIRYGIRKGLF